MPTTAQIRARIRYLQEAQEAGHNISSGTIRELERIADGIEYRPDEILAEDEAYHGTQILWEM